MGHAEDDKEHGYLYNNLFHRAKSKHRKSDLPIQGSSEPQLEPSRRETVETGGRDLNTESKDRSDLGEVANDRKAEKEMSSMLWTEAYEQMRKGAKRSLVLTYEEVLTRQAFESIFPVSIFS